MKAVKFFVLLIMFLMLAANSGEVNAAEKNPVRLACLPIIFQGNVPDTETCAILETKLARATFVPLNGTLKVVDYIKSGESVPAMQEVWKGIRAADKRAKLRDAMKPLAQKINADLIVCPVILGYNESITQSANFSGESHLSSYVSAMLIVYDRRTDDLDQKKTSRMYNDSYNKLGTAASLASDCFDRLIDETNIRRTVMAIK